MRSISIDDLFAAKNGEITLILQKTDQGAPQRHACVAQEKVSGGGWGGNEWAEAEGG